MALTLQAQDTDEPFSDTDYELLGNPKYRVVSGCAVTYDAANLTVDVAAGVILHNGTFVTVSQQLNVVTIAVDGSNPRWSYLTINGAGTVILTSGTPAATPVKPEAPEGVFLAMLKPVNGDTIANDIAVKLDKRIWSELTDVTPTTLSIGTAAGLGTGDQAAREDHVHGMTAPATPTTVEIGDAAAVGSGTDAAREDHIHAVGDPATPTTQAHSDSPVEGTSVIPARSDHKHGMPAAGSTTWEDDAPTAITFGDAGVAGVVNEAARGDHQHAHGTPGTPDAITFGQPGATGSGTEAAREDHAHAMEAAPTGVTFVEKTSDESLDTSTTVQDDDELTFTMVANKRYAVMACLLVDSGSTPDFKYALDLAGTSTWDGHHVSFNQALTSTNFSFSENDVVVLGGRGAGTPSLSGTFSGIAKADGSGGAFTLQWAQNASDAGTTQLLTGSWLAYKLLN